MTDHIILNAFGTTGAAKNTYSNLGSRIAERFPDAVIHWSFSSPAAEGLITEDGARPLASLASELTCDPANRIVCQSLHVIPAKEFHRMVLAVRQVDSGITIGLPLLATPEDYSRVAAILMPLVDDSPDKALLVLGHGTEHPAWTAYPALQSVLRKMAGTRVFVAALEKFPPSDKVIDDIIEAGFQHVVIMPFLMVAGMHFRRDIIADHPHSWATRLAERRVEFDLLNHGLGAFTGIADIFCDHIGQAFQKAGTVDCQPT